MIGNPVEVTPFDPASVHVVVTMRERYSETPAILGRILASIPDGVRVTLVCGGMPGRIEREVELVAGDRVQIVGPARHLSPNTARTVGMKWVEAPYVAFIDNDVVPTPGWLEALVRTACSTGAWAVRPVVMEEHPDRTVVHEAGGSCHLEAYGDDDVVVAETHYGNGHALVDLPALERQPVELFEFHTVLFDRSRLEAVGGMDERLLAEAEHLDLALRVHRAGGSVWLEPTAVVTYRIPRRLTLDDLRFFLGRWSPSWSERTHRAFQAAHGVADDDPVGTWDYPRVHRSYAWLPLGRAAAGVVRGANPRRLASGFDRVVGRFLADAMLRLDPRWRGGGLLEEP